MICRVFTMVDAIASGASPWRSCMYSWLPMCGENAGGTPILLNRTLRDVRFRQHFRHGTAKTAKDASRLEPLLVIQKAVIVQSSCQTARDQSN